MATLTTYWLISGADAPENVKTHSLVEENELELQAVAEGDGDRPSTIRLAVQSPLEEQTDLQGAARDLSEAFPEAVIIHSVVEERFNHIERVHTTVFMNGHEAGEIEHGYVFNVGGG